MKEIKWKVELKPIWNIENPYDEELVKNGQPSTKIFGHFKIIRQ